LVNDDRVDIFFFTTANVQDKKREA